MCNIPKERWLMTFLLERSNVPRGTFYYISTTLTLTFCVTQLFRYTLLTDPNHNVESHMQARNATPDVTSLDITSLDITPGRYYDTRTTTKM